MDEFDPHKADNHPEVEARWAMAALHHAETYMGLLKARDPSELRLTPCGLAHALVRHTRTDTPRLMRGCGGTQAGRGAVHALSARVPRHERGARGRGADEDGGRQSAVARVLRDLQGPHPRLQLWHTAAHARRRRLYPRKHRLWCAWNPLPHTSSFAPCSCSQTPQCCALSFTRSRWRATRKATTRGAPKGGIGCCTGHVGAWRSRAAARPSAGEGGGRYVAGRRAGAPPSAGPSALRLPACPGPGRGGGRPPCGCSRRDISASLTVTSGAAILVVAAAAAAAARAR
jgi:hypothetical protein